MTHPYVDQVAAHLGDLPPALRDQALSDLTELLDAGISPSELGPAEAYAQAIRPEPQEPSDEVPDAQATVFGVPVEGRGATDRGVRSRIWAPQDERILVPRLLGGGWMVNLGAVAVRLGLLRPDDWDEQTLDAVPPDLLKALRWLPVGISAAALTAASMAWRPGADVPTHWTISGVPDRWGPRWLAWVPAGIAAGVAAWSTRPADGDDRMIRPALGMYGTSMAAMAGAFMAFSVRHPDRPTPGPLLVAVPFALLAAGIAVPVTLGIRRTWREVRS